MVHGPLINTIVWPFATIFLYCKFDHTSLYFKYNRFVIYRALLRHLHCLNTNQWTESESRRKATDELCMLSPHQGRDLRNGQNLLSLVSTIHSETQIPLLLTVPPCWMADTLRNKRCHQLIHPPYSHIPCRYHNATASNNPAEGLNFKAP